MKRTYKWVALLLVFTLLAGCGDSGNYIKENYSLVDVQGQGKSSSKVYSVTGKDVPTVAKELAEQEKPQEISKESPERMFLVYSDKIIHVQDDPNNEDTTLVELDTIQYAKDNYDSSFLQGYLTASLLQSLFGGGWFNSNRGYDYRGYTSTKRYEDYEKSRYPGSAPPAKAPAQPDPSSTPTTSERQGSFKTTPTPSQPSTSTDSIRKNDGSAPNVTKKPSATSPSTSKRSGSFKRK